MGKVTKQINEVTADTLFIYDEETKFLVDKIDKKKF